jgi:hypothetical protein
MQAGLGSAHPTRSARSRSQKSTGIEVGSLPPEPHLTRNLFEYGAGTPVPAVPHAAPAKTVVPEATAAPTPEADVKLVGIVRRADGLRAALSVEGEVAVLAKGQSAQGYTVTDVSEDGGVRVRTPAGAEIVLTPKS